MRARFAIPIGLLLAGLPGCHPRPTVCDWTRALELDAGHKPVYTGTLAADPRARALFANLAERKRRGLRRVRERLGVGPRAPERIALVPHDLPWPALTVAVRRPDGRYEVIGLPVQPFLNGSMDLDETLVHELTHAVLGQWMGPAHDRLPAWLREGLAGWTAGQLETNLVNNANCALYLGVDFARLVDGLDNPDHGAADDLEDSLAIEYLAQVHGPQAVRALVAKLITSTPPAEAFEQVSATGWPELSMRMAAFARERLAAALADSGHENVAQARQDLATARYTNALAALRAVERDQPASLLQPLVLFSQGEVFMGLGLFADAAGAFSAVLERHPRCFCLSTASMHRLAQSLSKDGATEAAIEAWERLLRDYPLLPQTRLEVERQLERCTE